MRVFFWFSVVAVCLNGWINGVDAFLNCPSLRPPVDTFDRRCCQSSELPNGCECFDVSLTSGFTNLRRPQCPPDLGVEFYLYTRSNQLKPIQIRTTDSSLEDSTFVASRPTRIIIHGWTNKAPDSWSKAMKDELLKGEDLNVILVNWSRGARQVYFQSVANLRTVGAMVANLVIKMADIPGGDLEYFHLIGHSLGAHMSGFAEKEIYRLTSKKIARISGLDPAGLAFEGHPSSVRLDKIDAHFVDVIHTDAEPILASGHGIMASVGHADFFPNGGVNQPGCPLNVLRFLYLFDHHKSKMIVICSHIRVLYFFTNSINKCRFDSPTGGSTCTMGYHVNTTCRGDHYPKTTSKKPFC